MKSKVSFAATQSHIENHEGDTLSHAILKFESGVIAHLECLKSNNMVGPINDFRITGTKGELLVQRARDRKLVAYTAEHRAGETIVVAEDCNANAYGYEIQDFAEHVLRDRPLAATGEYSLGEFRTAQAIYRSAESGKWENVWD